jgi:hypothetical protein
VTARFVTKRHTRTLHVQKDGDGRVTGAASAIDCGSKCTAHVERDSPIRLVAKAGPNAKFDGWSGRCTGTGPCEFTAHDDVTVTALFEPVANPASEPTLTVTRTGAGSVTSTPAGIACGRHCVKSLPTGTPVVLIASPNEGSRFTGWSGACTGVRSCSVTMSNNRAVTAHFDKAPPTDPTLTVDPHGDGSGTVKSKPVGIACGDECAKSFPTGTPVVLIASPNEGSQFAGWGAPCESSARLCKIVLRESVTVTAHFTATAPPEPKLTTSSTGKGTISPSCPAPGCSQSRTEDVTVTASPADGWFLKSWGGDCASKPADATTCTVTMSADREVSAVFAPNVS